MTHEEIRAALSAYADGEVTPETAKEISGHLPGCKECSAAVREIQALTSGIKSALAEPAPAAMKKRVLAKTVPSPRASRDRVTEVLITALVAIIVVLFAGVALKKYMPSLFMNIQGMINGAASTLGSSAGNN